MIKNDKGITLIALSVAVIIILAITGMIIYSAKDSLYIEKLTNMQNDISTIRDKISLYYSEYGDIPASTTYPESEELERLKNSGVLGANDTGDFLIIELENLDGLTLNYGIDYENYKNNNYTDLSELTDIYLINANSYNIFYLEGINVNEDGESKIYYTDYTQGDSEKINIKLSATMTIEGTNVTKEEVLANLPTNFYYVGGEIDDGIVISDNIEDEGKGLEGTELQGNQFVWVPVAKNQRIQINIASGENIESVILTDPYGNDILTLTNLGNKYNNTRVEPTINGPYLLKVTTATEEKTVMLGVHSLYAVDTFGDWYATEEYAIAKGYESLVKFLEAKNYDTVEELMLSYSLGMNYFSETEDYTDQVNANGGFYIGRYEASYNEENVASKPSESTRMQETTDLSNGMLWNCISQTDALANTKNMYSIVSNKNFASSLLTGAAWDRTLGWLYETGEKTAVEIIGDSKSWGNYSNDTFTNTTSLVNTGAYSQTEANHIFDLAGNLWEWTTEADNADNRFGRGGYCGIDGSSTPASSRRSDLPSYSHDSIGFRPALYLNS